jgi:hypothetical protein
MTVGIRSSNITEITADPLLWVTLLVMGLSLVLMVVIPIVPGQFIIWLAGGSGLWPHGRVAQIGVGDFPAFDCADAERGDH